MSAVKWAFAIVALLIGAVLAGVFAQMASQVFVTSNFTISEQSKTEPKTKVVTTTQPPEPVQSETVEKPAESAIESESAVESVPVESRQIVDYDLVSYWKFDGGEAGLDNYGTTGIRGIASGTERYVEGKIGQAFDFTGQNYITIPHFEELNSPSFSVTFWINPYQLRIQGIMDKIPSEGWASGWRVFMRNYEGNIEFDASGEVANINTPPIKVGKWSFVAVTYDHISKTAKIYLDGVLSAQVTGVDMQNNHPNKMVIASPEDVRLDGRLDEIRFYNIALHEIQIEEIYNMG